MKKSLQNAHVLHVHSAFSDIFSCDLVSSQTVWKEVYSTYPDLKQFFILPKKEQVLIVTAKNYQIWSLKSILDQAKVAQEQLLSEDKVQMKM